jgi:hypothetical protein
LGKFGGPYIDGKYFYILWPFGIVYGENNRKKMEGRGGGEVQGIADKEHKLFTEIDNVIEPT